MNEAVNVLDITVEGKPRRGGDRLVLYSAVYTSCTYKTYNNMYDVYKEP